ncbi:hypothetical protein DAPPUDRAFT_238904 [Daphnia pulex]|uniref:Uncharacterized protein n=1 Tax=Daphnia pulex TaxID=6669 RepID=E9G7R5_DAPPU|nr:hypothetical protein DAPPUDRAFT_238904 [Daphnia pulex]|eukprot:EFX84525.1 hypothetical protein DAPPUDRAFT_238904 [Daphnia pulex]
MGSYSMAQEYPPCLTPFPWFLSMNDEFLVLGLEWEVQSPFLVSYDIHEWLWLFQR